MTKNKPIRNLVNIEELGSVFDPSYAEKVLRARQLYQDLLPSDRKQNARQAKKRVIDRVSRLINRDRDSVKEYLSHSANLNQDTLNHLVAMRMPRSYFIKAQKTKLRIVSDMQQTKSTQQEIEAAVSNAMIEMQRQFTETGKVSFPTSSESDQEHPPKPVSGGTVKRFSYQPPTLFDVNPGEVTESMLESDIEEVHNELGKSKKFGSKAAQKRAHRALVKLSTIVYIIDRMHRHPTWVQ